jgi:predicted DCC family thiol-disulfide oxidoreductase YuxK
MAERPALACIDRCGIFESVAENLSASRRVSNPPFGRPLLIFDGDCPFCCRWVERWQAARGKRFDIEPSQTAAARFPELAAIEFEQAVQFIEIDGRVFSAAEAVLRVRSLTTSRSWVLACYKHVPGVAPVVEAIYRGMARHRSLLLWAARVF